MKKTRLMSFIGLMVLALSLGACDFSSIIVSSSSSDKTTSEDIDDDPNEPYIDDDSGEGGDIETNPDDNPDDPEKGDENPDDDDPEKGDDNPDDDDPDEPECKHDWHLNWDSNNHWYECSLCGQKSTPEAHDINQSTTDPTCGDIGSYDTYCTVCEYKTHEDLPATGEHIWDSGELTIAPTCLEAGEITYHCTVCQTGEKIETVAALGHDFSGDYLYDESGHWKECLNGCGAKGEESSHDLVDGNVKTEATCTEDGERYITCPRCGYEGTMTIAATGHTLGGDIIEVPATCQEDGSRSYTCSVCGEEIEGEIIPALGHEYKRQYDATNHWEECSRCGDKINESAHSYNYDDVVASKSPTCQEDGYNSYKCVDCEYIYVETVLAGEAYHDWQVISSTAPTCLEDGTTTYQCATCQATKTEISAEKLGHDWAHDELGNYIYTDSGDTHYVACTRCEAKTNEGSHTYPDEANSRLVEPSCYEEGSEEYLCIYCSHQDIRSIDPTGEHDWYVADSKANTCGEDGYITYKCQTEGCTEEYTETLPATGEHEYELINDDPEGHYHKCSVCNQMEEEEKISHTPVTETTTEATCLEDGSSRTYCSECGYEVSTDSIPAVGSHTYEIKEYVEPSCTEEGYYIYGCLYNDMETVKVSLGFAEHTYTDTVVLGDDEAEGHYRVCDVCHQREEEITPHNFGSGEVVEATCTCPSGTKYTCLDCNYSYIEDDDDSSILGHDWDEGVLDPEPTCTEAGERVYTCSRCNTTYSEKVDPLGHEYDSGVVTLEPTCVDAGETTYTCIRCGDSYTLENIPATGVHTYVEEVIDPTCEEQGYTIHTCLVCGVSYQDSLVSALGHDTLGYGCDYDGHWVGGCSRCHYYDGEDYSEIESFHDWATNYDQDGNMYCLTCGYTQEIHLDDFNVYYDDTDPSSEAHIWGYSGARSEVIIPMYVDGHRLTYIQAGVLCERQEITFIHIPSTLEYLYGPNYPDEGVFQNCTGLNHLNIDYGMLDVGDNAFYGCTGLTYINLPASILHINAYAFYDCSALHELVCPDSVSWLGDYAFGGNCGQLDQLYGGMVYWTGDESSWSNLMYNSGAYNSNYCFCNSYCSRYDESGSQSVKWLWRWVGITPTPWGD